MEDQNQESGGPRFAPAPFTNDEFFEVNDALNMYLNHLIEVGPDEVEIKYNTLNHVFNALVKTGTIISGQKPMWVDETKAKVDAAIKKAQTKKARP